MTEEGLVGRNRRQFLAKNCPQGLVLGCIPCPGGCGMGIDRCHLLGTNTCICQGTVHAGLDGGGKGQHRVMGIGTHAPARQFHCVSKPMGAGEVTAAQNKCTCALGQDKSASMHGKRTAGRLWRRFLLALFGNKDAVHSVEASGDWRNHGTINSPT